MGDPKYIYDLRQVVYDAQVLQSSTNTVAVTQDIDDTTSYAGVTEALGGAWTVGAGGTNGLAALAARLEFPKNLVFTVAGAHVTQYYARAYGIGMNGRMQSELFTITAAGTYTGNLAFLTCDRVAFWGYVGAGLDTTEEVMIGVGTKVGLPMPEGAVLVDVIKERFNSVEIINNPAGVNRTYGTYIPTSTLDASKVLELWYTIKIPLNF